MVMTMTNEQVLDILKQAGVLLDGHFLLTSGKHSAQYMQCAKIFSSYQYSKQLCGALAEKYADEKPTLVVGIAMGSLLMAYEMAAQFGCKNIFAERVDNQLQFRRGFEIDKNDRILVVEDVVTTGKSTMEVMQLLKGYNVIGVGSIVDRSNGAADFGVPFKSVVTANIQTYDKDNCPLCAQGIEVVKPGSRKITD